ncbi:MAG: GTP 3',8-cyclase MoaA [Desulfovibrionaceae bacterium]|nr:GTP 3',8-cyclase MoaA [Desulfovibrionaceae bacterium]
MITDNFQRSVSYMRFSVTDRCNLACVYCARKDISYLPHEDILRYEELMKLIGLARELKVSKVRLTGGEPFARKGFVDFVREVHAAYGDLDLRITTNGTLLAGKAKALFQAGVKRLNISLDTLDAAKFERITGRDLFWTVRKAVDECLDAGIGVKINTVALKGVNDDELPGLLELARKNPLDLRFIEFMPIGHSGGWSPERIWTADQILDAARNLADLEPVQEPTEARGPARMFRIRGGAGRIGLISPLSNHFCATCNRLRITASGGLRTCLFSDREYRLRPALRHPKLGIEKVRRIIELASKNKPMGFMLLREKIGSGAVCHTNMSSIGG